MGALLDSVRAINWSHSKPGTPKPKSIAETMIANPTTDDQNIVTFDSPDDFKKAREALINGN